MLGFYKSLHNSEWETFHDAIGAYSSLILPDLLLDVFNPAAKPESSGCPEEPEPPESISAGSYLCSSSRCFQTDTYLDLPEGLNHLLSNGPQNFYYRIVASVQDKWVLCHLLVILITPLLTLLLPVRFSEHIWSMMRLQLKRFLQPSFGFSWKLPHANTFHFPTRQKETLLTCFWHLGPGFVSFLFILMPSPFAHGQMGCRFLSLATSTPFCWTSPEGALNYHRRGKGKVILLTTWQLLPYSRWSCACCHLVRVSWCLWTPELGRRRQELRFGNQSLSITRLPSVCQGRRFHLSFPACSRGITHTGSPPEEGRGAFKAFTSPRCELLSKASLLTCFPAFCSWKQSSSNNDALETFLFEVDHLLV